MNVATAHSYRWCEQIARRAAKNFYPAFRLLPLVQRRSMCALYAFLRVADDLADSDDPPGIKRRDLAELRRALHEQREGHSAGRSKDGAPQHPVANASGSDSVLAGFPLFPALYDTMHRHGVPVQLLDEALDGVEQDLTVCRYETYADLSRYCYLVAGTVGLCCVRIWSAGMPAPRTNATTRKPSADWSLATLSPTPLATAAGQALQLTNILRDVAEDIERERVYLPAEDLQRFGVTVESLRRRQCDERFRALMRFEAQRAYECYNEAAALAPYLPPPGRAVFLVLTGTYRALLDEIARRNYDVFTSRVRLPRWYKLWLAARALPVRYGLWD